jgi:hypothetical protein
MYYSCTESKQKSLSIAKISTTASSRKYITSALSYFIKILISTSNYIINNCFINNALHPYIL